MALWDISNFWKVRRVALHRAFWISFLRVFFFTAPKSTLQASWSRCRRIISDIAPAGFSPASLLSSIDCTMQVKLLSLLGFSVNLTECSTGSDRGWLCRAQCLQNTSSRVRLGDNIPDTFLGTLAFWIFLSFPRLWWVARAPASRYSLHWNTLWITGGKKTLLREWTSEKNTSPCLSHIQNIVKETLTSQEENTWTKTNVKDDKCKTAQMSFTHSEQRLKTDAGFANDVHSHLLMTGRGS